MANRVIHFLECHRDIVRVRITRVRGSAPREEGTDMFVATDAIHGTIGGGQLEYMAIDTARALLKSDGLTQQMDVPLGPEIGQCCGGHVSIVLDRLDDTLRTETLAADAITHAARPDVLIFGAGHIGRALAGFFAHLPVRAILIDSRQEELNLCSAPVDHRLTALPEAEIRAAKPGSAFIILTHDHALDYLLAVEALARSDAAYVGMIGSATKRARFQSFCNSEAPETDTTQLICPVGAASSSDKRPEVIASFVAAEVMAHLTTTKPRARLSNKRTKIRRAKE